MTTDFWSITWNTVKRYMLCTEKGLKIEETMNNPLQPSGLQIWTCYMYSLERWGSYSRKTISLQIGLFPQVDNHSGLWSHKIKHSCVKSRHTSVQTDMMKFTTSMTMLVCVAYTINIAILKIWQKSSSFIFDITCNNNNKKFNDPFIAGGQSVKTKW